MLRDFTPRFVGSSIGPSVRPSFDAGSRVSSLVLCHLASPIGVELFFAMLQAKSGSVHPQLTNAAMRCLLKKQIGEAKTVSQLTII